MVDRKEPTISGLRPEMDETYSSAQARSVKPVKSSKPSSGVEQQTAAVGRSQQRVVVKTKSSPILIFLVLISLGFSGFIFWQLMQSQNLLNESNLRISELEGKLELTGDESTASITALQANVKLALTETDKLWATRNVNKKSITANKKSLDSLTKQVKSVGKEAVNQVKKQMASMSADVELLNELVSSNQASVAGLEAGAGKLSQLDQQINKLADREVELRRLVKENQEAIDAIDAFRRKVNQQLLGTP